MFTQHESATTDEGLNFWMEGIIELGSNFCRHKGSSVSSCPLSKAGVRAHPSVVNFGSMFGSVFYLPACRCLSQCEDDYLGHSSNVIFHLTPRLCMYSRSECVHCYQLRHQNMSSNDLLYHILLLLEEEFRNKPNFNSISK